MGRTTSNGIKPNLGLGGAVAVAVTCGLWSGAAEASGFAVARFGGEHGHPTTDNATAIYYNPAGIALSKGTHVFVDGTVALRWASYDRPSTAVNNQMSLDAAPGANDGKATLFNGVAGPFIGATSDFGTDFMVAGAAVYFPFGGSAVWDKNPAYIDSERFPGAQDGTQRWYSIDGTIRSMYITTAAAFNIEKIGLTLGLSGSVIRSEVVTIRARNTDGTDDLLDNNGNLKEGRSYIDVKGWQGGFALGATYNLLKKDKLWLGASYTSQPNVVGGMTLEGSLYNTLALAEPSETPVELTQTLPEIVRFGARYRPTDRVELRLFGDFTRWSVFDKQCVLDTNVEGRSCEFDGVDTALDDPEAFGGDGPDDQVVGVTQHLPRYWKNAGGVRVGASYWFLPRLEGYLGLGFDSTAVPLQTLDPALMDMNKVSVSAGARWQIIDHLGLAFTSTELFFMTVDTEGENALNKFQSPTRQPDANGEYKQFFQLFNLYADVSF
ncbi:OmpP1/FadL family transporter [Paraliomyxa miuraensis]|uniref:OmpP1/FadL family transporter n=1 Tax=Paraliomyxa miuraensis TaxID=376150 RepID=UPI002250F7D8|nr:outer membrane protein transport protein [Paraliomyxa miuraensis]MCX4243283.1 outer membrane protein transport protein [Paraliomyxa miuraensis]